ncbi:TPA: hypothetical protein ACGEB3_002600, partial [Klebsiella pneumoniae]
MLYANRFSSRFPHLKAVFLPCLQ